MKTNEQHAALVQQLSGLAQKWAENTGVPLDFIQPGMGHTHCAFIPGGKNKVILACALELRAVLAEHQSALPVTPVPAEGLSDLWKAHLAVADRLGLPKMRQSLLSGRYVLPSLDEIEAELGSDLLQQIRCVLGLDSTNKEAVLPSFSMPSGLSCRSAVSHLSQEDSGPLNQENPPHQPRQVHESADWPQPVDSVADRSSGFHSDTAP